jgi:hypothetical protein
VNVPDTVTRNFDGSLDNNPSFEQSPNDWHVPNGTKTWACAGQAYHASCYIRALPSGQSTRVLLRLTYDPRPPSNMATASNYNEFVVRCPSAPNPDNQCKIRVGIEGIRDDGSVTATGVSAWKVVTSGEGWESIRITHNNAWPSATDQWRFFVEAAEGDTIDADYHQQSWDLPN